MAVQAVDETQERLEVLSGELDDMCRRLGLGDSFQVRQNARRNAPRNDSQIVPFCFARVLFVLFVRVSFINSFRFFVMFGFLVYSRIFILLYIHSFFNIIAPCFLCFCFFFVAAAGQGRSVVTDHKGGFESSDDVAGGSGGDKGAADSSGDGAGMGPREFKALEGLTPVEARLLVTSLVDDVTASGIGEMLQQQEATKQVGGPAGAGRGASVRAVLAYVLLTVAS